MIQEMLELGDSPARGPREVSKPECGMLNKGREGTNPGTISRLVCGVAAAW